MNLNYKVSPWKIKFSSSSSSSLFLSPSLSLSLSHRGQGDRDKEPEMRGFAILNVVLTKRAQRHLAYVGEIICS